MKCINSASQALPSIAVMSAWQGAGYQMIIFLGGIQAINPSDITTGIKNATLKYFLQWLALFIRSASPNDPSPCNGTIIITNLTVLKNVHGKVQDTR